MTTLQNILSTELERVKKQRCDPFLLAELEGYYRQFLSAPSKKEKDRLMTCFFLTLREVYKSKLN